LTHDTGAVIVEISEFYIFIGVLVCFAAVILAVNKVRKPKEE
jgi:hypothetical protein